MTLNFKKDIQCIAMELNVANKKYVIFSMYRPPKQNMSYFLDCLSERLDFYSKHCEIFAFLVNLMQHLRTNV